MFSSFPGVSVFIWICMSTHMMCRCACVCAGTLMATSAVISQESFTFFQWPRTHQVCYPGWFVSTRNPASTCPVLEGQVHATTSGFAFPDKTSQALKFAIKHFTDWASSKSRVHPLQHAIRLRLSSEHKPIKSVNDTRRTGENPVCQEGLEAKGYEFHFSAVVMSGAHLIMNHDLPRNPFYESSGLDLLHSLMLFWV